MFDSNLINVMRTEYERLNDKRGTHPQLWPTDEQPGLIRRIRSAVRGLRVTTATGQRQVTHGGSVAK